MDVLGAVKNFGQPKNQAHRCQVCPSNRDNHPMRYIRLVCESSTCEGGCTWQAKLHVWSKAPVERENLRDVYAHTFVLGEHNSNQGVHHVCGSHGL
ncbi:TPA: hypothetical protein N0F65_004152 [Lagenidium giganteum]|uniref:Uncharacterized protein n=1 Tax=Lagenidium giganteum TaxID=4803 RepID=A0AAV2ZCM1_9STRA|nr:TPA: hypothetical protein N0F65_004152 [Lagenidium giganteum]